MEKYVKFLYVSASYILRLDSLRIVYSPVDFTKVNYTDCSCQEQLSQCSIWLSCKDKQGHATFRNASEKCCYTRRATVKIQNCSHSVEINI